MLVFVVILCLLFTDTMKSNYSFKFNYGLMGRVTSFSKRVRYPPCSCTRPVLTIEIKIFHPHLKKVYENQKFTSRKQRIL